MKSIKTDSEFKELASKCQEGIASEEEVQAFDEAYELLVKRNTTWDNDLMGEKDAVQLEIQQNLFDKVERYNKRNRLYSVTRYLSAAVILIIAGVGSYFFYLKPNEEVGEDLKTSIIPGSNKATLTLADGRKFNLTDIKNGAVLEQAGIQITKSENGQLLYKVMGQSGTPDQAAVYNTVETPTGGQYQIVLPDGTKVWLNAASSLKFPLSFASMNDRRVELKGEAYFEVTKDKDHPFKVINDEQEVEVLGTHFNINSYKDGGAIKTTLLEGSVVVTSNYNRNGTNPEVKIKPGEQAILTTRGINVVEADVEQVIDWKNGDFIFQKESLKEIMTRIARWYNVEIVYDQNVNQALTFTGQVSRAKRITEILKNLESTGEIKFEVQKSKIKVKNNQ